MVTIKLVDYEIRYTNYMCTEKQYAYLRHLMNKTKHEEVWLNKLAFYGRERLTISEAAKLIDAIKNNKEFRIVEES